MKYLKVWTDFEGVLSPLKDDEIGRLFLHMIHYAKTGEEPSSFVGNEAFIWPAAKRDIDVAAEKAEKMRENGLKGGRPKNQDVPTETDENQTKANESKNNQTKADLSHKTRQDKTGHDMTIHDMTKSKRFTPPTLQEVTEYCQSRNNGVDPQRFIDFYASKGWMVGKNPMKDWKACVRTWEGRDKTEGKVIAQNYDQRDYHTVQDELIRKQNERIMKRLNANNFEQRDYSDVPAQMLDDLEKEMEAFKKEVG